ncbi:hypothetical protein CHS0354_040000 [Potamilus streckersoni]|uniref:Uncharacterized protein n=1 Tax=Potamilus streckersoni TaxID=2493646 RepID=A0AAE0S0S5_9BIVA|nr:hypothetical protein CHS0354_040000 [Potamilus streckersoni]
MKIVLSLVILCMIVASVFGQVYSNDPSSGLGVGTGYCSDSFCSTGLCYGNEYNLRFDCTYRLIVPRNISAIFMSNGIAITPDCAPRDYEFHSSMFEYFTTVE